ncbi:hypothetical protein QSH82_24865, partial [Escherichia coli]|uniref:hypothetical protein n=1 Tax=Escherichia coli TaxID=562 RepID=UPI00256EB3D8
VRRVLFYDIHIGNTVNYLKLNNNAGIGVKAIYRYKSKRGTVSGLKDIPSIYESDFKEMAARLNNFIAVADTA